LELRVTDNKTGDARANATLRRVQVTNVAVKKE